MYIIQNLKKYYLIMAFGSGKQSNNKDTHPFERLLKELNIKHTKPSHPQTNGKIIWRI